MSERDHRTIPIAHLVHLLRTEIRNEELAVLVSRGAANALPKAYAAIEATLGRGTVEGLKETWSGHAPCAVHLWDFVAARDKPKGWLQSTLSSHLGRRFRAGSEFQSNAPEVTKAKPSRIASVLLTDQRLYATARIYQIRRATFAGDVNELPATQDVPIELSVTAGKVRVIQVVAALQLAKVALARFLLECFGMTMPQRKAGRPLSSKKKRLPVEQPPAIPVRFSEPQVRALAARLKMAHVGIEGKDARGFQGDIQMSGQMEEGHLVALNAADPVMVHQDASANYARTYNLEVVHPDKFKEQAQVRFFLKNAHPHVHFRNRASQLAIDKLIAELGDQVLEK